MESRSHVRAYVPTSSTRRVEAELVAWTPTLLTCALQKEVRLPAAVGDGLSVWLVLGSPRIEHELAGRLDRRVDERTRTLLTLSLTDPSELLELLRCPQVRAMDRRQAIRTPATGPITLIADGGPPEVARLVDVSTGGIAFDVSPTFEERMAGRDSLQCVFRLPSTHRPLAVDARVRHRVLTADGFVRYGVMFTDDDRGRARDAREAIAAWQAS
jgi:hypothetical protein